MILTAYQLSMYWVFYLLGAPLHAFQREQASWVTFIYNFFGITALRPPGPPERDKSSATFGPNTTDHPTLLPFYKFLVLYL